MYDISEKIALAKINNSKECMMCDYWFFDPGFKVHKSACNGCHDLTALSVNIVDIAIITVKSVGYCCTIHNISQFEAIKLLKILGMKRSLVYIKKYHLKF